VNVTLNNVEPLLSNPRQRHSPLDWLSNMQTTINKHNFFVRYTLILLNDMRMVLGEKI
jgi:hypothetical protein